MGNCRLQVKSIRSHNNPERTRKDETKGGKTPPDEQHKRDIESRQKGRIHEDAKKDSKTKNKRKIGKAQRSSGRAKS